MQLRPTQDRLVVIWSVDLVLGLRFLSVIWSWSDDLVSIRSGVLNKGRCDQNCCSHVININKDDPLCVVFTLIWQSSWLKFKSPTSLQTCCFILFRVSLVCNCNPGGNSAELLELNWIVRLIFCDPKPVNGVQLIRLSLDPKDRRRDKQRLEIWIYSSGAKSQDAKLQGAHTNHKELKTNHRELTADPGNLLFQVSK